MNCTVAFAPEGDGPEAKSITADLLDLGKGLYAWCGREARMETSMPTKVLQRLGPVSLHGPSLPPRAASFLISLRSQGCPWTKSDGRRGREAGVQQSAAAHLLLQSVC